MYESPQEKLEQNDPDNKVGLIEILTQAQAHLDCLDDDYSAGQSELESLQNRLASGQFRLGMLMCW